MAEDITLLSPLTGVAQIRRVKPTDPENDRRSNEQQQRRSKERRGDREPRRSKDAVEVDLQKAPTQEDARETDLSEASQPNSQAKPGVKDKAIDIRV